MNLQSGTAQKVKTVLDVLEEVEGIVSTLAQSVSELKERVNPILRPEPGAEAKNLSASSLSSPAGGRLEILTNQLQNLNNEILRIRDQVEF